MIVGRVEEGVRVVARLGEPGLVLWLAEHVEQAAALEDPLNGVVDRVERRIDRDAQCEVAVDDGDVGTGRGTTEVSRVDARQEPLVGLGERDARARPADRLERLAVALPPELLDASPGRGTGGDADLEPADAEQGAHVHDVARPREVEPERPRRPARNDVGRVFGRADAARSRGETGGRDGGGGRSHIKRAARHTCHVRRLRRARAVPEGAARVGGDEDLRRREEARDLVHVLVADHLADALLRAGRGGLDLDHDERHAVDEEHDVRPAVPPASRATANSAAMWNRLFVGSSQSTNRSWRPAARPLSVTSTDVPSSSSSVARRFSSSTPGVCDRVADRLRDRPKPSCRFRRSSRRRGGELVVALGTRQAQGPAPFVQYVAKFGQLNRPGLSEASSPERVER